MTTRRDVLLAICALVAPLPGAAQSQKTARIGFLSGTIAEPALGFLRQGLLERGLKEGQDFKFDVRVAEGKPELMPRLAAELVGLKADVIVAIQTQAVSAAKSATTTIPIVMGGAGDPVGTGLITSLARPGGNITGMSSSTAEVAAKHLEIFREIRPATKVVAVLANVSDPFAKPFVEQIQSAGRAVKIDVRAVRVRGPEDYEAVFTEWRKMRVDAVLFQPSLPRAAAINLSLRHRMMLGAPHIPFAEAGGLFAYAASTKDLMRKTATYVDKILKGARPADLPVEQPTSFELFVNLKTAKAIGVVMPRSLLARADRIIE